MDKSAIEKIVALGAPNIVEENGYIYTDKNLTVITEPTVETLNFKTLTGLAETLKKESAFFNCPLVVSALEHDKVKVVSSINVSDRQRETPYTANAETPDFAYGRFMPYEDMMIALKSKFVETQSLLNLVQLLGTITEENTASASDDGFSQSVVVKKGIALKDNKVINPRVRLTPFRTFVELEQPESEFLLRLQEGGRVALFEADGGAWKLKARENVANYLRESLDDLIKEDKVLIVEQLYCFYVGQDNAPQYFIKKVEGKYNG